MPDYATIEGPPRPELSASNRRCFWISLAAAEVLGLVVITLCAVWISIYRGGYGWQVRGISILNLF